jgi:hypothetical protein
MKKFLLFFISLFLIVGAFAVESNPVKLKKHKKEIVVPARKMPKWMYYQSLMDQMKRFSRPVAEPPLQESEKIDFEIDDFLDDVPVQSE